MIRLVLPLLVLSALAAPLGACTIFTLSDAETVLFASNEDGAGTDARIWFVAPAEGRRGAVYFGFSDGFRQGGMNDRGLCYDITACPRMTLETDPELPDPELNLLQEIMDRCDDVEQALTLLAGYNLRGFERVQVLLADRSGATAAVDCNHVTRGARLVTNHYLAAPDLGRHPCDRFDIATALLPEAGATVDDARRILSAVRQEGRSQTQYSFVCEPRAGRVSVWRFHDFEQVAVLDLESELSRGDSELELDALFPGRCHALEAYRRKQDGKLSSIFTRTLDAAGLDAAVAEYRATKINHSEILNELAALGFELQGDGRTAEAAVVFGLMTEDFPAFARGWEWLGNARVRTEDYAGAEAAYRRCLEVDPENRNARDVLDQLTDEG